MSQLVPLPPTDSQTGPGPNRADAAQDLELSVPEVRQRAVVGAAVDAFRGIATRLFGLVGVAVLARLLSPHSFGIIAFGVTFTAFSAYVADGGVGTALIRRSDPPEREDFKALLAFQLVLTTGIAALVALAMSPFGQLGAITGLMVFSLPFLPVRASGVILCERALNYKPLALVDMFETVVYYVWAIAAVSLGFGLWGLASATIARAIFGSGFILLLLPETLMTPAPSWKRVKRLLGFGFKYQAVGLTDLARDQTLNVGIATVAGVTTLGLSSVATRILQVPNLLFNTLWRVSFPGMSRLVGAGEDLRGTIERVIGVVAVGAGLLLAPLAASSPGLIPVLLGARWKAAAQVIPGASLGLMIVGPVSVALAGYLWAVGDASVPLRATLVGLPMTVVPTLLLLPVIGISAIGLAVLLSAIAESTILINGARKHIQFTLAPQLGPPVLFAAVAGLAGWLVQWRVASNLPGAFAGGATALTTYLAALAAWHREYLFDLVKLTRQGLRGAVTTLPVR